MRLTLAAIAITACHKQPAREIPPAPTSPTPIATATGSNAPANPYANVAPDPKLYQVPSDVVAHVRLEEIAHGLPRPVLITHPPNDARLFVIEQR
ncbi:MAG TPA: hypothetical protein VGG28_20575, partial [Kofleriaceae bacterium]